MVIVLKKNAVTVANVRAFGKKQIGQKTLTIQLIELVRIRLKEELLVVLT